MTDRIHPAILVVVCVLALGFAAFMGYQNLKPPATISGIGRDGKPMTQDQIDDLARKMSGGRMLDARRTPAPQDR